MTAHAFPLPAAATPFATRLRLGSGKGVPVAALHDRAALADLLARMRAARPAADPRALASLVAKAACGAAIPGPLAAAACGLCLDIGPQTACFVRDETGRPAALVLPAPRAVPEEFFVAGLFGALLAPLFEALADVSGVSPRVLWSNAGNVSAWTLGTLLQADAPPPRAASLYRVLHAREGAPWRAGRNPLHSPVRWRLREAPGPTPLVHRRRVCCLRDRAGEALCRSCPRLAPALTPRGCPP